MTILLVVVVSSLGEIVFPNTEEASQGMLSSRLPDRRRGSPRLEHRRDVTEGSIVFTDHTLDYIFEFRGVDNGGLETRWKGGG
ncbi:hypothetical protein BDV27DRAFT_133160 [Aspergillus caelatus]|uniref:Uncharacterized protein n=1 Tax=Aspergillus caelatus TaxID=61420 RepID=A0A5N6ZWP9_9EURO|nr:uncharacterized protein BDV27DRAFT_133160 [Aspergillus caelatus]KAE8361359.1 hypothetical protein BDV27DRAFT_133160 [Aspergillus caelatus]